MSEAPQLIVGNVMHKRLRPAKNAFCYPVFYVQVPLRNTASTNRGIFSVDRGNLMTLRSSDHGPHDGSPLLPWIQRLLCERGLPDDGEIVLQAFPRVLGMLFNPVSFWFCHDRAGALIAVLAEVNNTFGGRHNYLLHNPDGAPLRAGQVLTTEKRFHVSPFCDVVGCYRFRFFPDRDRPLACIDYDDGNGALLLTAISGRRMGWSLRALLTAFLKMPFLAVGVIWRIHWQALKLWLKGVPFHGMYPPATAQTLQEPTK